METNFYYSARIRWSPKLFAWIQGRLDSKRGLIFQDDKGDHSVYLERKFHELQKCRADVFRLFLINKKGLLLQLTERDADTSDKLSDTRSGRR